MKWLGLQRTLAVANQVDRRSGPKAALLRLDS
ncbi:MAG TPA: hypothetical protein [Caudoviricetes sp.]|nr:MAG TPA: hypothetical protein [Caudoviricetes sp.]